MKSCLGYSVIAILIFSFAGGVAQAIQQSNPGESWRVFVTLGVAAVIAFSPKIIRYFRMRKYFQSPTFLEQKAAIKQLISEHNEISEYIDEIRSNRQFSIGASRTGANAQLSTSTNTSRFGYRRDRNVLDVGDSHVHHASLQVVRNADLEPIKYLMKYFGVLPTEEKLAEVEELGESISRLESAVTNLRDREAEISASIAPPKFILKHYRDRFMAEVGLSIPPLSIPYPRYKFQYVSAGGNSSQETTIRLDSETVDALIEELSLKIKFRKSAAGQRALMTATYREQIKSRDSYTCQTCGISTSQEPHLLLEVDHIVPVSKGGMSVETNLQTLCWRCNRSKSNKEL